MSVKVTLVRTVSDEEQIRFESEFASGDDARCEVRNQLALCRDHMRALNEEVTLIHREQSAVLDAEIQAKGDQLRQLNVEIQQAAEALDKQKRRLTKVA